MNLTLTILNSRYFFWMILALPSLPMVASLAASEAGQTVVKELLHPTGEFAARFMIIAMVLTPLRMMFPQASAIRWLLKRRRYIGVAAFAYAALHTALYIVDLGSLQAILGDFLAFGIWTGWLAMFIFIPLAVTSNDWSVRRLGRQWKPLQRTVYVAAVATLLHWIFVHNDFVPALVHFVPLAALEAYRIWHNTSRTRLATT